MSMLKGGQTDKSRFLTSLAGCALWHRSISVGTNIYHHLSTVQLVQQYLNKRYLRCHRHSVVDVCVRQSAGYSRALGPSRTLKGAVWAEFAKATAMDDGSFTPRTQRVTLGRGRFCTTLPPLSGQIWIPNAPRLIVLEWRQDAKGTVPSCPIFLWTSHL